MGNWIIIAVIVLILALGFGSTRKHFQGEGGCCGGGGGYKPRKKKLKKVTATKVFHVEGMHCRHCSDRVTEVVNDIAHVAATVDLKAGTLTVFYEEPVEDAVIFQRIRRAGYTISEENQ